MVPFSQTMSLLQPKSSIYLLIWYDESCGVCRFCRRRYRCCYHCCRSCHTPSRHSCSRHSCCCCGCCGCCWLLLLIYYRSTELSIKSRRRRINDSSLFRNFLRRLLNAEEVDFMYDTCPLTSELKLKTPTRQKICAIKFILNVWNAQCSSNWMERIKQHFSTT